MCVIESDFNKFHGTIFHFSPLFLVCFHLNQYEHFQPVYVCVCVVFLIYFCLPSQKSHFMLAQWKYRNKMRRKSKRVSFRSHGKQAQWIWEWRKMRILISAGLLYLQVIVSFIKFIFSCLYLTNSRVPCCMLFFECVQNCSILTTFIRSICLLQRFHQFLLLSFHSMSAIFSPSFPSCEMWDLTLATETFATNCQVVSVRSV